MIRARRTFDGSLRITGVESRRCAEAGFSHASAANELETRRSVVCQNETKLYISQAVLRSREIHSPKLRVLIAYPNGHAGLKFELRITVYSRRHRPVVTLSSNEMKSTSPIRAQHLHCTSRPVPCTTPSSHLPSLHTSIFHRSPKPPPSSRSPTASAHLRILIYPALSISANPTTWSS